MSASVAAASSRVFLTVHGINGDEGAGEAEFGEQGLHRRNFVRLLVTVEMRQHQRCIRRERAQNMCGLAVLEMVEAATQCLAVDGDMALPLVAGLRVENGGVTSEYLLHRRRIQLLENEADRAVGRRAPPRQHEKVAQPDEMDIDEAVNCTVRVGPGQHGQYGEQHDVREMVKLAFRASRVFEISASRVRKGVSEGMATSVRPNQVAHQRVRDFNLLESRLRWPSTNLRRFVTFRTHPSQELSVEQPCSRWENAPTLREIIRLTYALVDIWCESYPKPPKSV